MASKANDPMVMAILAKHKPPEMGGEGSDEDEGGGADEGLSAAASEAMDAVKAGDAEGFKAAMLNFFNICDGMPHVEGSHEGEEE